MPFSEGNATPSSREAREYPHRSLTSPILGCSFTNRLSIDTTFPSTSPVTVSTLFTPQTDSPLSVQSLPRSTPPVTASVQSETTTLSSSVFTSQSSIPQCLLSHVALPDSALSSPALNPQTISAYFQRKLPLGKPKRITDLVLATQSCWQAMQMQKTLPPPETVVHNICVAYYVRMRKNAMKINTTSGKGRLTAAFKATATELLLDPIDVKKGWEKGVNYLDLTLLDGPGSLFLTGHRTSTLWEKDIRRQDVPHLLEFRTEFMPAYNKRARNLDDPARTIIIRYIAAKSWKSQMQGLTNMLNSRLLQEPNHRKQLDTPPALASSDDQGLMQLLEPTYVQCENTCTQDQFSQSHTWQELDITSLMETFEDPQSWPQDSFQLAEEPDITSRMETFGDGQSNVWFQDPSQLDGGPGINSHMWLHPSQLGGEPDITSLMKTSEDNMWLQDLLLDTAEELTFNQDGVQTFEKPDFL